MKILFKIIKIKFILLFQFLIFTNSFSQDVNINETLIQLQKDLKTLEKAVYSNSVEFNNTNLGSSNLNGDNNEDVLTRHLLKLSEIENQFQELTNRFEEINFKLDKLSNRMSKVQADNQVRFQDLENVFSSNDDSKKLSKKTKDKKDKTDEILPGSSEPQDLGSISYKDTATNETSQQIQSIETTATIVTETFQAEDKILPMELRTNSMNLQLVFKNWRLLNSRKSI